MTGPAVAAKWRQRHISDCQPGSFMIRFLSRFVGLWLVAGALVALVIDATKSIAASELTVTPLGAAIDATLGAAVLKSTEAFVTHDVGSWLWNPLIVWVLALPAWAVLGVLGFFVTYLGSRPRARPKYA